MKQTLSPATRASRVASVVGSAPVHRSGAPIVPDEQRLDGEVVTQCRYDRRDLHDPSPNRVRIGVDGVVAIEVHDDVERLREHLAHDALGHVLPRHQRGVHQSVERLRRAVGVNGAEEAAAGVDRAAELERLGAAHLADDDPIGPHRQHELHEVAQTDLAGTVERRGSHLVVRAVRDRHRQLADLLARAHAVARGRGREQRRRERRLARARFTGHRDPAAQLHQEPEERRRLGDKRVAIDEIVERDVAHDVATQRRRELIARPAEWRR